MQNLETIYQPKTENGNIAKILLSQKQKNSINKITLGIDEVDETIRQLATEDVIKTLENGHPLNRLIEDESGDILGYIACEDFIPHEAYIKYFGAKEGLGRNFFKEIPAFFEYAKKHGYVKLNFHGWNEKLNHILEHFGFEKIKTDKMNGFSADFYQKNLMEKKTEEDISEERKKAFERKYINKIKKEYEQTLKTFSKENQEQKEKMILETFQELKNKLLNVEDFEFRERQEVVLKLKLARYFQNNENIDINTLLDAIIENPKFIGTDKGSLHRLFEIHEQKTLERIAQMRKKRAGIDHNEKFNPYESLLTTKSGKYHLARLLNMPHLEEESEYMRHCVGTSDSYINKIKRGEIEILSFRHIPKFNQKTGKFDIDEPIITIEYNLKTKEIEQMKKADDGYLKPEDPYFEDVIDALKKMRQTETDMGEKREIRKISNSELNDIPVKDYHLLTENGEVDFHNFNLDKDIFILKIGKMEITPDISQEDAVKIMRIIEGVEIKPEELAREPEEVNKNTKAYIGEWNVEVFQTIKNYPNIKYLYESFPDKEIFLKTIETDPEINSPEMVEKELANKNVSLTDWARDILYKTKFSQEKNKYDLVRFTVKQLNFPQGATTEEINKRAKDLGLELCPAEVGPYLMLQYSGREWTLIAVNRDDNPDVFDLYWNWNDDQPMLNGYVTRSANRWNGYSKFIFRFRK